MESVPPSLGLSRRNFLKLSAAGVGGVVGGALAGKEPEKTAAKDVLLSDFEINKVWGSVLNRIFGKQNNDMSLPIATGVLVPAIDPEMRAMDYFGNQDVVEQQLLTRIKQVEAFQKMRRRILKIAGALGIVGVGTALVEKTVGWKNVTIQAKERGIEAITALLKKQSVQVFAAPLPISETKKETVQEVTVLNIESLPAVSTDTGKINISTPTPFPETVKATVTSLPTAEPIAEKQEKNTEVIGDRSVLEYYFQPLVDHLITKRQERAKTDKAFLERIGGAEKLTQNRLNIVFVGIDQSKNSRPGDFESFGKYGVGLADMVMIMSFDPKTASINLISLPRDLYCPEVDNDELAGGYQINGMTNTIDRPVGWEDKRRKLITQVAETASAIPIDGVVRFNMDLISDFEGHESFFSAFFPDGLPVLLKQPINDEHMGDFVCPSGTYPCTVKFTGARLTDFVRARYHVGGNDYQRQGRLQGVTQTMLTEIIKRLANIKDGKLNINDPVNWRVIKEALSRLRKQTNIDKDKNQYPDLAVEMGEVDMVTYFEKIVDDMEIKMATTAGKGQLAGLLLNTIQLKDRSSGKQTKNLVIGDMLVDGNGPKGDGHYTSWFKGGKTEGNSMTQLGNFIKYWEPLRKRVGEMMK
ncbi:MAG: hypothetical protein COS76_04435 [Candidatus Portnoybacteria bacterium CG06_land_8_20_14_3_00_39_12]|uniref:Cell envelope-related transcriptional attenuator domain-containing protein n=1 Tax=Candidatus Portnoybacteria bacterium CG06_land_8_20_14_3_00_39_12 TaxID=1974809 RepID=A0A2M7AVX7_9BACT|nr:MAG: hypothetical protein COS76_04435 [Candidatus Portnoybacteria bacterium CG06_land_8_20_14_3_00_39_12]